MPQARLGTGRKPLGPDTNLGFVWLCHSEQYSINLFCFVFLLTSHPRGDGYATEDSYGDINRSARQSLCPHGLGAQASFVP